VLAQIAYRPPVIYVDTLKYLYGRYPGSEPLTYRCPSRSISPSIASELGSRRRADQRISPGRMTWTRFPAPATCGLSGAPKTGGCFGVPAAARSAKASTAGSGTRPVPQPSQARQAPRRHVAPTIFAMPRCRCGWPPAPRPPRSLLARAQRACPAHHLRPLHTRLPPDRQPAHRASPPPQPMAPRWPTKICSVARNPVRHASVPQLDSTGHSGT